MDQLERPASLPTHSSIGGPGHARRTLRQRLIIIAAVGLLNGLFVAGVESLILPLWVTGELKMSPAEWAQLRSLRWSGTLGGVVILGALSDRFGQRTIGALCMLGTVASVVAMVISPHRAIWIAMPFFGALVSAAFVNMNVLTQQVSADQQGFANAVYRSMGAAASVAAPVIATSLAAHYAGYRPVLLIFAGILTVAVGVLFLYKGEARPEPLSDLRSEIRQLISTYVIALRQRELMRAIHLTNLWGCTVAGVGAFAAIRFTRELHQSPQYFASISAVAGALTFGFTAISASFLDRVSLRKFSSVTCALASLCIVLLGMGDSTLLSTVGYILFCPINFLFVAPVSMWISRAAGGTSQASAFSVHKVVTAGYVAATMAILGVLEQRIGMRQIFLYGGLAGVFVAISFIRMPEPGKS